MMPDDAVTRRARETLIDALQVLRPHLAGIVVVGAQAIYLRVASDVVPSAPYTRDADLCIHPRLLPSTPGLQECMAKIGFRLDQPGIWKRPIGRPGLDLAEDEVDLLVPATVAAGGGRRGVSLGGDHERTATRRTPGLEACLVDNDVMRIQGVSGDPPREIEVAVAGTAGLLLAKMHKLHDRVGVGRPDRVRDKDALDVFRILSHEERVRLDGGNDFAARLAVVAADPIAASGARAGVEWLRDLFGAPDREGCRMAARALEREQDPEFVRQACAALANAVLQRVGHF